MASSTHDIEGGCTCGHVRYKVTNKPLIVHCCHCRYCQQQSGASFAVNALIEAEHVELLTGSVDKIMTKSPSGKGQQIVRCPECKVAVWSNYYFSGLFERICFIRVGTLDNPDQLPPDVHIFTSTKQPWVVLPPGDLAVDEYYKTRDVWSDDSYERLSVVAKAAGIA